jgi:hypothetical protein
MRPHQSIGLGSGGFAVGLDESSSVVAAPKAGRIPLGGHHGRRVRSITTAQLVDVADISVRGVGVYFQDSDITSEIPKRLG